MFLPMNMLVIEGDVINAVVAVISVVIVGANNGAARDLAMDIGEFSH